MFDQFEKIRIEKGLKYSDIARGAGIPYSTITDWKAGRYTPKFDKLKKIADFLDIDVWKITDIDQMEKDDSLYEAVLNSEIKTYIPKELAEIYNKLSFEDSNRLIDFGKNLMTGEEDKGVAKRDTLLTDQERELLDIFRYLNNPGELLRYARYLKDGEKASERKALDA